MGLRFILLLLALVLIIWIARILLKNRRPDRAVGKPETVSIKPCAWCGLHIPADESIQFESHYFCSNDHKQRWLTDKRPR